MGHFEVFEKIRGSKVLMLKNGFENKITKVNSLCSLLILSKNTWGRVLERIGVNYRTALPTSVLNAALLKA